jgi:hypothetical protein
VWRRYELSNASLSEPRLDSDAVIRPLGKDRQFQDQRNGLRYDVIERRYAIFPQASGKATLAPVTVTAQVMERASSLFELFGRAVRTRRISAPAVPLEVRPVPAEFPAGATWLPAPRVRLNELWAPDDATARVGEPVSRTVSLWVSGQTSGQLPELLPAAVPDLKVYADQPQMKDDTRDDAINAVRQEKAALVAEAAGTFEIPAVTLPWWNTATDTLEFARLPSRPLQILAAPGTPEPSTAALPAPAPAAAATPVAGRRQQVAAAPADWLRWRGWFPVACVALLGWAMTVVVLRRRNAPVTPAGDATSPAPVALAQARDAVLKAARTGVANDTAAALLDWARLVWPDSPPLSLGELARRLPAPLAREIANLEATRHARTPTAWRGEALREALSVAPISAAVATSQAGRLPDIFRLAR